MTAAMRSMRASSSANSLEPAETFETGIRKTVQWYLDNQGWANNVLSVATSNGLKKTTRGVLSEILLLAKWPGWLELQRSLPLGEVIALDSDSRELCGDFTKLDGLGQQFAVWHPTSSSMRRAYRSRQSRERT